VAELDLEHRDKSFEQLTDIQQSITKLKLFPSLVWVWAFDVMKDIYDNYQYDHITEKDYVDEAVPSGVTFKQIFDKFWEDVDKIRLSMEYGDEIVDETIRDWMRDNDFLVSINEEDEDE
jgi:hypothetical protein